MLKKNLLINFFLFLEIGKLALHFLIHDIHLIIYTSLQFTFYDATSKLLLYLKCLLCYLQSSAMNNPCSYSRVQLITNQMGCQKKRKRNGRKEVVWKLKIEKKKLATKSIYVIWHQETAMGRWNCSKMYDSKVLKSCLK